jgi:hypothetical protein
VSEADRKLFEAFEQAMAHRTSPSIASRLRPLRNPPPHLPATPEPEQF